MPQNVMIVGDDNNNTLRYTALGDSLTAGVGTTKMEDTYPYILATKISAEHKSVVLNNFGIPGAKVKDVLDTQIDQALKTNPNLITLLIGTNDMHNRTSQIDFTSDVEKIITKLQDGTKAKIVVINIPYLEQSKLFISLYKYYFAKRAKEYNKKIQQIAQKYNLVYVDLYTHTVQTKQIYSPDLFHPSKESYLDWSNFIYEHTR
ncbi:MAG: hypothetical protein COX81_03600 [Candidatus Magasanikbacteria bacterium CG_4_10_14_0_2_um_filter_37_12]|uniref:SGNH hydrolase-type esterase domain-containing protein n=1 Tax=Candidatus Magasanikbacteria bacterium CG_4_10_14_0_2_um_filter_37_12 TaxID=1974637 RepID=A0A2M7V6V4_9BACT|nr:MAG: hypothetical protein COX81_03600 [Candidatus Magasanikbacteria bacterium CG_4_10_14_0_2_um_filter_37_12]